MDFVCSKSVLGLHYNCHKFISNKTLPFLLTKMYKKIVGECVESELIINYNFTIYISTQASLESRAVNYGV